MTPEVRELLRLVSTTSRFPAPEWMDELRAKATAAINAAASESWRPMETAPKDGTLVLLLIYPDEGRCCPLEDTENGSRTVGHNNFAHDGEDCWLFAGWSWEQDHYTQGDGNPAGWMPLPEAA